MPRLRPRPSASATAEEVAALLHQAEAAFDAEDAGAARALAEAALRLDPQSAQAHQLRAEALIDAGDLEGAEGSFAAAVEHAPENPGVLASAADFLIAVRGEERGHLERGLALAARGRKLAKRRNQPELLFELSLLEGIGLNQVGDCRAALERLDDALELDRASVDARLERGIARFELCDLAEAQADLEAVIAASPEDPWAHHYLGLIAERAGDLKKARRRFGRATELSPEDFPAAVRLTERQFDGAVEDAVARLPGHVKVYLENTTIAVEPFPGDEDLLASEPPLSPCILGIFRGTPVGQRSVSNAEDHFPASIVLYQRNLERFARSREELIEQIGITLMHEVGHLIGLDEEDLWERGLD